MRKIALISILVVAILSNTCLAAYGGGGLFYVVKPGDTLYGIGKKYGLNYHSLMETNRLGSTNIKPGLRLNITPGNFRVHTVSAGDNLYRISLSYGLKVTDIQRSNGLNSTNIKPGMNLLIPGGKTVENTGVRNKEYEAKAVSGGRFSLDKDDIHLLAQLIHAEARGESLKGQIAVGAVIMNRMASGSFPAGIREIIFQKTNGVYQFTPVQDGQINLEPDKVSYYAAERAIKGEDPTGGALFFYNPETSSDQWIRTLPVTKVIGNHVFAK